MGIHEIILHRLGSVVVLKSYFRRKSSFEYFVYNLCMELDDLYSKVDMYNLYLEEF